MVSRRARHLHAIADRPATGLLPFTNSMRRRPLSSAASSRGPTGLSILVQLVAVASAIPVVIFSRSLYQAGQRQTAAAAVPSPIFLTSAIAFFPEKARGRVESRGRGLPQIHGGISAPRSPRFRASQQLAGIAQTAGAKQSQVAGGKGIRFAEGAHGYVLRRPLANSGQLAKLL